MMHMHEYPRDNDQEYESDLKHKAYEKVEHMFLNTSQGQRYKAEHQQLEHERRMLHRRYEEFRNKMKHDFHEYLKSM